MHRATHLYRLTPIDLPSNLLDPGEYIIRDRAGVLLSVTLDEPMSSAELADMIAATDGEVELVAA